MPSRYPRRRVGAENHVDVVRVVSPADADDEVFNTYGELGNAKLLSSYGFAQRDNPRIASRSGCLRCERRQRCEGWRGRR